MLSLGTHGRLIYRDATRQDTILEISCITVRVLLLNYEYPPAGGGAGFATHHIARELATLDVQVDVLTSRIRDERDAVEAGVDVFRVPSWRKSLHDCGFRGAWFYVANAVFRRNVLLRRRRYDLEHFFFSLPTGAMTLLPSFGPKPPYVVSLRGSDVPGYDLFNAKVEKAHRLLLPFTRRIWRRAARVVALSDALREIALRTTPELDIDVIPNGIDPHEFYPSEVDQDTASGKLKVICVARLLERKGIHHLLRAIAEPHPLNLDLTIVGTGPYQPELQHLASSLGLDRQVTFAAFVEHTKLAAMYRDADIFALPSQTESFGLVFAEAMASGLPVVATAVGGIPEIIREGREGFLVEPQDHAAIRQRLELLLGDCALRARMSAAARQRIEEKFTWRRVALQYLEVYRDVLSGTATGRAIPAQLR